VTVEGAPLVPSAEERRQRLEGCLLGTAVGDALGLPCEGLSPAVVARRFLPLDRFRLVGARGFVSDDTEQSALVVQSLCGHDGDDTDNNTDNAIVAAFRRALLGWFWRLPFGVGLATIRAALRLTLGLRRSGVASAGNGAAMRSMVLGAAITDGPRRRRLAEALARVTHTDPRAVGAAIFVADVAAGDEHALSRVDEPNLRAALEKASDLAEGHADLATAVTAIGTSGFVMHSVPFAWFCLNRWGVSFEAVTQAIQGGGDTDTNAAIVGGWVGALKPDEIPAPLVERLAGGPFGPRHLRALARSCASNTRPPFYAWPLALLRNLALYPVVLAHGFRRLLP
jgi:ADP-ribosyl-[dinitrogen reductase] hydrolase